MWLEESSELENGSLEKDVLTISGDKIRAGKD